MDHPTQPAPDAGDGPGPEPGPGPGPRARRPDPPAVALANASLLAVGYLMLGRRRLAMAAVAVTVVLVVLLATAVRAVWWEVVVLLWWAAQIAHGWLLAGGAARERGTEGRRPWLVALGVTLPVLLAVGLLRFDTSRIEHTVDESRDSGDCGEALEAQRGVWFGHRIADAPGAERGDRTVEACHRLEKAGNKLTLGLGGDLEALAAGRAGLAAVRAELPGHGKMADVVWNAFLRRLPGADPCDAVAVTDWLRDRRIARSGSRSDSGAARAVARTEPVALDWCGDQLMAEESWKKARARYQQLLDRYPDDKRAAGAKAGVRKATLSFELDRVNDLLEGPEDTEPAYCSHPAKYSGARPFGKGDGRALFYGDTKYPGKLPGGWRADGVTKAELVVCLGEKEHGASVQTCPYEAGADALTPVGGGPPPPENVTFHKVRIPVKAYELRTGKRVVDADVQIGGASCPPQVEYSSSPGLDMGPPDDMYVKPSKGDVRAAFGQVLKR